MMKDEDVERLLRAMPLRKPARMPGTLSARPGAGRRAWTALGGVARGRIPAWQAAAAALLAVALYAGASALFSRGGNEAAPTPRTEHALPRQTTSPDADTAASASSQAGFWRLPPAYTRMAAAAWKKSVPAVQVPQ